MMHVWAVLAHTDQIVVGTYKIDGNCRAPSYLVGVELLFGRPGFHRLQPLGLWEASALNMEQMSYCGLSLRQLQ
jgi:hypothetical protein